MGGGANLTAGSESEKSGPLGGQHQTDTSMGKDQKPSALRAARRLPYLRCVRTAGVSDALSHCYHASRKMITTKRSNAPPGDAIYSPDIYTHVHLCVCVCVCTSLHCISPIREKEGLTSVSQVITPQPAIHCGIAHRPRSTALYSNELKKLHLETPCPTHTHTHTYLLSHQQDRATRHGHASPRPLLQGGSVIDGSFEEGRAFT